MVWLFTWTGVWWRSEDSLVNAAPESQAGILCCCRAPLGLGQNQVVAIWILH